MTRTFTPPIIASYIIVAISAVLVLHVGLVLALFSGLLVYSLVHLLTPMVEKKIRFFPARIFVLVILSIIVISSLSLLIFLGISFAKSDAGSLHKLLQKMAAIIEASRPQIPLWLSEYLPSGTDALREVISDWLRAHGTEATILGQTAGHSIIHLLMGMIIGGMLAIDESRNRLPPLAMALQERADNLQRAFQRIVFAQVQISAINAVLSAIYLLIILPACGIHLPLSKTMVLITFITGLLPVAGNVISNAVVVTISLSHSLEIAVISLLYMVVIHKLEYFLNAKIIGIQINARAWELLTAMLILESIFGLSGLVAAPVFYACLKIELGMGEKALLPGEEKL